MIRFFVRRWWRQQPISSKFNRTNDVPETTPIRSSNPEDVTLVLDGDEWVGRPPNEEAGSDGGGASTYNRHKRSGSVAVTQEEEEEKKQQHRHTVN